MALVNHRIYVYEQKKFEGRPWTSICSGCGNEGQFRSEADATSYANFHASNASGTVVKGDPKAKPVLVPPVFQSEEDKRIVPPLVPVPFASPYKGPERRVEKVPLNHPDRRRP